MTARYSARGPTWHCSRCGEHKPLSAFGIDSRGYVRGHCRRCAQDVTNEWKARNRDRLNAYRRERYATFRAAGVPSREAANR